MASVYIVSRSAEQNGWNPGELREFSRVPCLGEHLTSAHSTDWLEVKLVVHYHSGHHHGYDAEVYCLAADSLAAVNAARESNI